MGGGEIEETDQGRLVAGRYRLSKRIGRGGMGTVWLATDELLDRPVAVKKLRVPPQLDDEDRERLYERTRREARSAARISHPGVIIVHDVVDDDGLPCIVMEHVRSRSLGDVVREDGALPPETVARAGLAMAAALRAAHAAGVLHRDVKPANVLLSEDGERIVLTDFGIAAASGTSTLTRTGEFIGSIDYSAPERMQGGESSPAVDAWALGATLYEAVEGVPPFRRATWMETAYATASEPPRPMERAGVLASVIERLLEKRAEDRLSLEEATRLLSGVTGTVAMPAPREERTSVEMPGASRVAGAPTRSASGAEAPGEAGARDVPGFQNPYGTDGRDTDGRDTDGRDTGGRDTGARGTPGEGDGGSGGISGSRGPKRRRGLRTAVWTLGALVAAAAVAGGTLWLTRYDAGASDASHDVASSTSPMPSRTGPSKRPPVAPGYHRVRDPLGFSVDVPNGWTRKTMPNGEEVDYLAPSGRTGLKFSLVDFADGSPLRHWRELEPAVRKKSPGYHKLRMNATRYQDKDAAIWEYTWDGRVRPYHAIDLGFAVGSARHFVLYLSAPDANWAVSKRYFDTAVNTFRVTSQV
jgi:tRNA A-37 threonylcarbamoyl transferase component Bud32